MRPSDVGFHAGTAVVAVGANRGCLSHLSQHEGRSLDRLAVNEPVLPANLVGGGPSGGIGEGERVRRRRGALSGVVYTRVYMGAFPAGGRESPAPVLSGEGVRAAARSPGPDFLSRWQSARAVLRRVLAACLSSTACDGAHGRLRDSACLPVRTDSVLGLPGG
jgi:hypothetical protein